MGTLTMEKLIENCPILLTDTDQDEGKVINMEMLKKKSLGYYPLSDKIIIVAIKGSHIIFNQDNILILADYEKKDEVKKEIKTKKIILNNSKSLTFNNVKKKSKHLLMTKVKSSSGKEVSAIEMYEHVKSLDDVDDTILGHLTSAKDKEKKKIKDPKKADKEPKSSKPKKSSDKSSESGDDKASSKASSSKESSKSSSSDSSKADTEDSSSDKGSDKSEKSGSKSSGDDNPSSGESGGEKVLTDEDEEFSQAAILSKKLERMSEAGNKLAIDLNRSLGELERGPSHR